MGVGVRTNTNSTHVVQHRVAKTIRYLVISFLIEHDSIDLFYHFCFGFKELNINSEIKIIAKGRRIKK